MRTILFNFLLFLPICIHAQIIDIPDPAFKAALIERADSNQDGEIEVSEIDTIQGLYIGQGNIQSIEGIKHFTSLRTLSIRENQIAYIDVSGMSTIRNFYAEENILDSLNLSGLTNLRKLWVNDNNILQLDLNDSQLLSEIRAPDNKLQSLDISGLSNMRILDIDHNELKSLTIGHQPLMSYVGVWNNELTTIDVSGCERLTGFGFYNNPLISLFLKNGSDYIPDYFVDLISLRYICADEAHIELIKSNLAEDDLTNVEVNSYCSFVPGGDFSLIEGSSILDIDDDGCSESDPKLPHIKYQITSDNTIGVLFGNGSGDYSIPVHDGDHVLRTDLEHPDYFDVSPSLLEVQFPFDISPYTQDFCFNANGVHNDLAVQLISLDHAQAGFRSHYIILYQNKGNTVLSGQVELKLPVDLIKSVSTDPSHDDIQGDVYIWQFQDLLPFESRSIDYSFRLHSPMDNPPLNDGDLLCQRAQIVSLEPDENTKDNTFSMKQHVINSLDPNDKQCLQGEQLYIGDVGSDLHYKIRFENNGSAAARNIVIKDTLDPNVFELSTLEFVNSSHDCVLKQRDSVIEVIFEGIDLDFQAGSNQGYVVFRIQTKEDLILGDEIKNSAGIYFDFNFPIITNEHIVSLTNISDTSEPNSTQAGISVYPNPGNQIITVKSESLILSMQVISVEGENIYNFKNINETNFKFDGSTLPTGIYLVKLNTNDGLRSLKISIMD